MSVTFHHGRDMLKLARSIDTFFQTPRLVWLYAFMAICSCLYLGLATPPFQTPDAPNHFYRAYQVASGTLLQRHVDGTAGGNVDTGVIDFAKVAQPLQYNPDGKWTIERQSAADAIRLSHAERLIAFPNTAGYPAWNYFPQALVFLVLRGGNTPLSSIYKAICLFDAAIAILLTGLAIRLSRRTRPMLFVVALLPETLSLFASVSQDSTLLPLCFLLVALLDNLIATRRLITPARAMGLTVLIVAVSAARVPYLGLLLMFLIPGLNWSPHSGYAFGKRLGWTVVSAIISMILFVAYAVLAGGKYGPDEVSMAGQVHYLSTHLPMIPKLLVHSLAQWGPFYLKTFIAGLGWFDVWYPARFYLAATIALLASLALAVLRRTEIDRSNIAESIISLLVLAGSSLLVLIGLYLAYTPVGGPLILGVQGRYFLPLFPIMGLFLWPWITIKASNQSGIVTIRALCVAVILLFPVLAFVETMHVIAQRYY